MIDPLVQEDRDRLRVAVQRNFQEAEGGRETRNKLISAYTGQPTTFYEQIVDSLNLDSSIEYLPLTQQAVTAHIMSLAWRGPRWSVVARRAIGKATAKAQKIFLNKYSPIVGLPTTLRRLALDSAFGWSVAKVVIGPAPAGVGGSDTAPRCWRIDPTLLIYDSTASSFDEALYIGDTYLMSLDEARQFPGFNAEQAAALTEWTGWSQMSTGLNPVGANTERYAEAMTRLVDVYLPREGKLVTWPCVTDAFGDISGEPLMVQDVKINPYSILTLLDSATTLIEFATLSAVKALSDLANDLMSKTAYQARQAKRNPVFQLGSEEDADALINAFDSKPVGVADLTKLGLYTIPGPDPNVTNTLTMAMALFKQMAGNIDLALGNGAVTGTARQEQILAERVGARENVNRQKFEQFAADIGRKLVTLAFDQEMLEIDMTEPVPGIPGLTVDYSRKSVAWEGQSTDFDFEVVPYSTAYRSPEERIQQLKEASAEIIGIMQAAAQGMPLNIAAIIEQIADYRDLPELIEWWTGQDPTLQESAAQTAASQAPQGSDVNYHGVGNSGGGGGTSGGLPVMGDTPPAGGMQILGTA